METWVIILNSVMIISIILCVVMVIIVNNRNSYCAIFMYKDRKLWKYLIENAFQFNQTNEIEITDYLEDSKVRIEAYYSLVINDLNFDDKSEVEHFYENITKLKEN